MSCGELWPGGLCALHLVIPGLGAPPEAGKGREEASAVGKPQATAGCSSKLLSG